MTQLFQVKRKVTVRVMTANEEVMIARWVNHILRTTEKLTF